MNTKQIWQALTCNTKTEPYFDGVFSIDMLQKIKNKPKLIICNTDPSTKPGKHWVLFFFHNDTVDFFDSLGNDMNYYRDSNPRSLTLEKVSALTTEPQDLECYWWTLHKLPTSSLNQLLTVEYMQFPVCYFNYLKLVKCNEWDRYTITFMEFIFLFIFTL